MNTKIIAQGAEAKIILNNNLIIKDRISKSYRIKELDDKIRKHRTKSEKKLLEKASKIINAPNPFPLTDLYQIKMPFIGGEKLSENLNDFSIEKQRGICKIIGENIAKLHNADIIHGDLTTSNMILVEGNTKNNQIPKLKRGDNSIPFKIFFIDFGLGFISHKIEDKAVDLHLLKQALEAKHFKNWQRLFDSVLNGYKDYKDSKKVSERLKAIEKRGRYKF
jgi:TP53 regulating kinase-like protein